MVTPATMPRTRRTAQAGFIAGNRLTRHAMERMMERGLTVADVEDAIVNPVSTQPGNKPNTTKFFGVNADVVVDYLTNDILTAI